MHSDNQRTVLICQALGCLSRKSNEIQAALEREVANLRLTESVQVKLSGCPGLCQEGPIVMVEPEGVFYTRVTADDAHDIVRMHLRDGQLVEHLLYHDPSTGRAIPYYRDIPFYQKQQHILQVVTTKV